MEVVGIGDGGFDDLPPSVAQRVLAARVLIGGRRHLELIPPVAGQVRHAWPSPLRKGLPGLLASEALAGDPSDVVALASGDPLLSGIGTTLIEVLGADAVTITPFVSSETLARARMGWPAELVVVVSVVGRALERVRRHLTPGARLVLLCSDGATPALLAADLVALGWGGSQLSAWWHVGGAAEGSRSALACDWDDEPTPDLVVLCVEVAMSQAESSPGSASAAAWGPAPGRPESAFENDGQITKRDVRASALAHLRPTPGARLWDLGAGSGAVGIEWALAASGALVSSVERDPGRAERIARNAAQLGVPSEVSVVVGAVGEVMDQLPAPDAVFVGGGLDAAVLDAAWARLPVGGRFVAHAVTVGTEAVLISAFSRYGGELTRISVEQVVPLGNHLSWTPARAVVQWSAVKAVAPEEK